MDNFWKRVQAVKELYPNALITLGNKSYDENHNEVTLNETDIANKITEQDTTRANEATAKTNLKASAKAKLIAGEALTEDEANTIVL